ncbi:MAG: nucleotidyltransferase domain-containing protein [Ignavibacteriae bacterium]|nr:nucleotidyltransferase domain-containing protein [Ignavibacteriota bacterium]
MNEVQELINSRLDTIEQQEGVAILLAVESGSRAWGFPSKDSDFDVRFLYCRRPEFYLSINLDNQSDVIERPIEDSIDLSGWDIRKALTLFRKSNPPLLEWLQCPIIYRERSSFATELRKFLPDFYSPTASFFHYKHMAEGNFRDYLHGDIVWRKKYLYVLRPLLATRWIRQGYGPVPIEFTRVVSATVPMGPLREAIDQFIEDKRAGNELDRGPRIPLLSDFIEKEIRSLADETPSTQSKGASVEILNGLFRSVLIELWPDWFSKRQAATNA